MLGQVEKELRSVAKAVYMDSNRGPPRFELHYVNWTSGHLFATESDPPDASPRGMVCTESSRKNSGTGREHEKAPLSTVPSLCPLSE